jgi:acyl transferase domain-containing protein/SAM-dependent methyltransferase
LSHTLLLGRRHFGHRLACVIRSREELVALLGKWLETGKLPQVYVAAPGEGGRREQGTLQRYGEECIARCRDGGHAGFLDDLAAIADLHVQGYALALDKLFAKGCFQKLSLPTYPFARERYWVPQAAVQPAMAQGDKGAVLHPLVHRNTSDFDEQRYSTTLTGQEFFLTDHVVQGRKILPGVAYLEMAYAALTEAAHVETMGAIRLEQVTWHRPLAVDGQPEVVHVGLRPLEGNEVACEIYAKTPGGEAVIYAEGIGIVGAPDSAPWLDIAALRAACTEFRNGEDCYERFAQRGIRYGSRFRCLRSLDVGAGQVVAKLEVKAGVEGPYALHPSVADSALQAAIVLMDDADRGIANGAGATYVPYALESVQVFGPCEPSMWTVVRGGIRNPGNVYKFDIDVCAEDGTVRIRMRGLSCRELGRNPKPPVNDAADVAESRVAPRGAASSKALFAAVWDPVAMADGVAWPAAPERVLVVGGSAPQQEALLARYPSARVLELPATASLETIQAALQAQDGIDHLFWIAPDEAPGLEDDGLIEAQQRGVLACLRVVKALLALAYGARPLGWTIVTAGTQAVLRHETVRAAHAGVHGLVGSMAKEYPRWKVRLLDLEADGAWPLEALLRLPAEAHGNALAFRQGQWYRQQLLASEVALEGKSLYRQGGVYVVIGGAGGIGVAWTEYMMRNYGAQVVWIGRRALDATIEAQLSKLTKLSERAGGAPAPHYIAADATDRVAMERARDEIKRLHGRIDGVVHAAIVLADRSLAQMDETQFQAALAVKVDASVRLGQVFGGEALDFVLFFSSMQSSLKAPGQSNYAAGCTFKDAFAQQLRGLWPCAVKVINWGYWGSVGIVASPVYRERMAQMGFASIEPEEGMAALEVLLNGPFDALAMVQRNAAVPMAGIGDTEHVRVLAADRTPSPGQLGRESGVPAAVLARQLPARAGEAALHDLEHAYLRLLAVQLGTVGLVGETSVDVREATARIGMPALYDRWLDASLRMLDAQGYLELDGSSCRLRGADWPSAAQAWERWDADKGTWLADKGLTAQVQLVETMLRALPSILMGKRPATEVMFPDASMRLVEGIYKNNPVSDYFNAVMGDVLVAYVEERLQQDASATIRILEIGAGTGGTSALLFERLRPYQAHIEEYCYTDLSRAFLIHAEKRYGEVNPYLAYRIFDVSKPLAQQDIGVGRYDVVVATNVLHATPNIRQSVRNAKAALCTNGLLLLNELSENHLYAHLSFGLLDGWWLCEDAQLRIPDCPGLTPGSWQSVLEAEGYRSVSFPARDAHALGQQIVVALSDGIVRQDGGLSLSHVRAAEPRSAGEQVLAEVEVKVAEGASAVTERMIVDHVRGEVLDCVSKGLKTDIARIDEARSFAEYGLDSLMAIKLVNAINERLHCGLQTTALFDYSNVGQLVKYIVTEYKTQLVPLLQAQAGENVASAPLAARPAPVRGLGRFARTAGAARASAVAPARECDPIAIIGMSGRFPQSPDLEVLWSHLAQGDDLTEDVTRWDLSRHIDGDGYCRRGAFLADIDKFDPLFFNISGQEATCMDPQQRLFLEESWTALEDAGYVGAGIEGRRCGVYVGCTAGDYASLFDGVAPPQAAWGNENSVIPARIAYHLDLQGPAVAIDTACSSSLVAVHMACQSLRSGETDMALAGGVSIQATPAFHVSTVTAGMLSPHGRCHTFDDRADGFVPGEGVGVVVLKRLSEALADGDNVIGVIRGSGINQDGATNGITAPSALSQERLETEVYEKFGIDPAQIQMVEAHGTGTKLGDPIEYRALTQSFRKFTGKQQYCAIGSIKTNLGHTVAAAGVAGMLKVLLAMKHKQIPPSLHFEKGNANIAFEGSPFFVNTALRAWEVEAGEARAAAVSSFSISGTNAHLVIEEAQAVDHGRERVRHPGWLLALSARSAEQLRQQAHRLLAHCERHPELDCGDLSHTLLLGRRHFGHRLACVIRSREELVALLGKWLETGKLPQVYVAAPGEGSRREQGTLQRYGEECIERCRGGGHAGFLDDLAAIADLHVQGYALALDKLFAKGRFQRLSLPTYPFARERYWAPQAAPRSAPAQGAAGTVLHPLVQRNTSDLAGPRFSTTLTGHEFFLADHVVRGQKVLPGVAYLEMARAALQEAMDKEAAMSIHLEQVVWARPFVVGERPEQVHIGLCPQDGGRIVYDIYGDAADGTGDSVLYAQGSGVLRPLGEPARLDLDALRAGCLRVLDTEECYRPFDAAGIVYGARFRSVQSAHVGTGLAVARLALSGQAAGNYVLHPSMMDGALQVTMLVGEGTGAGAGGETWLPFALKSVEIAGECGSGMWAVVHERAAGPQVRKFDIDLCADDGTVCVRMRELCLREFEAATVGAGAAPALASAAAPGEDSLDHPAHPAQEANDARLLERLKLRLVRLLSEAIMVPSHEIQTSEPFENYGVDSILVVQLTNGLREVFADANSTLFFEYQTIDALSEHLAATQREVALRWLGLERQVRPAQAPVPVPVPAPPRAGAGQHRRFAAGARQPGFAPHGLEIEDVAIIGIAGRYAQSPTLEAFWENLKHGRNCVTGIPTDRWNGDAYFDAERGKEGRSYSKWGGFIDEVDCFDPLFFNISPREAERMDPQERLFLEQAYGAISDAGYTPDGLCDSRKVGVFAGVMNSLYPSGARFWSIPNRISYLFNFQGPSIAIDTACSSSLTAIHLALESLYNKTSECAIAGGVNLVIDPAHFLDLCGMSMLSADDRNKAFADGADGFVDGEGVGAIVLKPLRKAIADGDHVYGVIKGSMVNAGGRSKGYTVPNPAAQAQLVADALDRAGIDARTVSYIEAHGTGTALGDPIEIAGLNRAFQRTTRDTQFCAIGSAKSNIGHCESAAGIAAVTKVLLQLKHGQLAPSLHAAALNPAIDFAATAFVVQRELAQWKRPVLEVNGVPRECPRIAGISSFGAGGANAHVLIEEYAAQPAATRPVSPDNPALVVLSARNVERLREQARQLLDWMTRQQPTASTLADMAYTLQVGREAMEERLAVLADSVDALRSRLEAFLAGAELIDDLYRGQAQRNRNAMASLLSDEDMAHTIEAWVAKGKHAKLLDLWTKGLGFDWNRLYGAVAPKRISLPTYPFARERYWMTEGAAKSSAAPVAGAALHPLLGSNISDFDAQRFTTTLSGAEFFLADHLVQGSKVLPGVAHLEMALQALRRASRTQDVGTVHLRDVVWMRPVVVGERPEQVHIGLTPLGDTEVGYEIVADAPDGAAGTPAFSQGQGLLDTPCDAHTVAIDTVRAECTALVSGQDCYAMLERLGLVYGPRFQSVREVEVGVGVAVASLVLPAGAEGPYVLNPSMMDGALQTSIVLLDRAAGTGKTYLPFALEALDVLQPCPASMWAVVRSRGDIGDAAFELDIELCGEKGDLCARIRGLKVRALHEATPGAGKATLPAPKQYAAAHAPAAHVSAAMLAPVWSVLAPDGDDAWPAAQERVLVVGGSGPQQEALLARYPSARVLELPATASLETIQAALQAQDGIDHLFWIAPDEAPGLEDDGLIEAQERGVLACLRVVKALLALAYGARPLGWTIVTAGTQAVLRHEAVRAAHAGVHGLVGSMAKEYPRWKVRLLDLQADGAWPLDALLRLPAEAHGNALAFRQGQWYRQQLLASEVALEGKSLYRQGGVYVVIGGAGGIGVAWDRVHDAQLWRAGGVDRPPRAGRHDRSAAVEVDGAERAQRAGAALHRGRRHRPGGDGARTRRDQAPAWPYRRCRARGDRPGRQEPGADGRGAVPVGPGGEGGHERAAGPGVRRRSAGLRAVLLVDAEQPEGAGPEQLRGRVHVQGCVRAATARPVAVRGEGDQLGLLGQRRHRRIAGLPRAHGADGYRLHRARGRHGGARNAARRRAGPGVAAEDDQGGDSAGSQPDRSSACVRRRGSLPGPPVFRAWTSGHGAGRVRPSARAGKDPGCA